MPGEYKPCSVLSALHEQKKRYQPNMLIAISISLLLSALIGVYISTLPGIDKIIIDNPVINLGPAPHGSAHDETHGTKKVSGPVDTRPARYRQHGGFAGFNGYRIVRSDPTEAIASLDRHELPLDPPVEITADHIGEPVAQATGQGGGYGDGLPAVPTLMDIESPVTRPRRIGDLSFGDRNTRIDVGERDRPPVLKLQPVKYPKKGWHVDGVVKLVLVVDTKGNIRECQIVDEDPEGHDFAQALKDALYESTFFPPYVNGEKLGVRYEFTYEFCWDCPLKQDIEVTKGDLIVNPSKGR